MEYLNGTPFQTTLSWCYLIPTDGEAHNKHNYELPRSKRALSLTPLLVVLESTLLPKAKQVSAFALQKRKLAKA